MNLSPARSTMRHCPDCKAPNPQSRETCYACGVRLDSPHSDAALPGEKTFPCSNCGGQIPYHANACPHCGRVIESVSAGSVGAIASKIPVSPPDGWAAEILPNGAIRLWRTQWWKRGTAAYSSTFFGLAAVTIGFGAILFNPRRSIQAMPEATTFTTIAFVAVALAFALTVIGCIALIFLQEEILLAPGRLELRRQLGKKVWRETLEGVAVIRIDTTDRQTNRGGRYWARTVRAENLGQKITIAATVHSRDFMDGLFAPTPHFENDNAALIGTYIATITGWPFVDPSSGRY